MATTEVALGTDEQSTRNLVYTDDTALTLVLAEHLAPRTDSDPVEQDILAREFARAWRAEPWRGYGAGAAKVFELISAGVSWREAAYALFQGAGSYGNGGAMRVAPVALVGASLHHSMELARRSAAVTHAHDHGLDGAACLAAAAHLALSGNSARPLNVAQFVRDLARFLHARPWHEKFDRIIELAQHSADPEHAARALGHDVSALGSVPLAVLAFLLHPDQPAAAIRYAICAGGDTDTIAAMAGALAGARNGVNALPPEWLQRLEARARLETIADRLA